jgi:hypothetical protein
MPPATGFAEPTPAFVESLDQRSRDYYRRYRASQDLYGLADSIENALSRNKKCLTPPERKVVKDRIATLRAWAKRPDTMPEWACASFRDPAVICDLLGIEAELRKLAQACETGYDASWPIREREGELAPGLGVLPEAAALDRPAGHPEDMDLPWKRSPIHGAWPHACDGGDHFTLAQRALRPRCLSKGGHVWPDRRRGQRANRDPGTRSTRSATSFGRRASCA